MNFNDAWKEIVEICPNSSGFYIELSYRRVRTGNKTTTECVLIDDYSDKEIAAPNFRACIDEYKSIMGISLANNDIVEEKALGGLVG